MRSWEQSIPLPFSPVAQHTGCIHCTALSETTAGRPSSCRFRKPQADCQQQTPRRRAPCPCLNVSHILDTASLPPLRGSPICRRKTGFLSCKDNKQNMREYLRKTTTTPKMNPPFIRATRRKSFVPAKRTVEIVAATSAEPFQGSFNTWQSQRKHIFDKEDTQCKALTQSLLRLPFFLVLRNYKADRHQTFKTTDGRPLLVVVRVFGRPGKSGGPQA